MKYEKPMIVVLKSNQTICGQIVIGPSDVLPNGHFQERNMKPAIFED
jgi:hypothetical protein